MKRLIFFAICFLQFKNIFLISPEKTDIEELLKKFNEQREIISFQLSSQPMNNSYQYLARLSTGEGLLGCLNSETAKEQFKNKLTQTGEYSLNDKANAVSNMYTFFGAQNLHDGLEVDLLKKSQTNPDIFAYATQDLYNNLSIFSSRDKHSGYATLSGLLNQTKTIFGFSVFDKFLATPITDITELKKRQEIIKFLINNPKKLEELEAALISIQDNELKFINFISNNQGVMNPEYNMYFKTEEFPYNITKHQQKFFRKMNLTQWVMLLSLPLAAYGLYTDLYPVLNSGFDRIRMFEDAANQETGIHKKIFYGLKNFFEINKQEYRTKTFDPTGLNLPKGSKLNVQIPVESTGLSPLKILTKASTMGWIYTVFIKYPFHTLKENWKRWINGYPKDFILTHENLCGTSKLINSIEEISASLSNTPLKEFSTDNKNEKFAKLCKELSSTIFKDKGCFIDFKKGGMLHHGKVLATAKLLSNDWTCMLNSLEKIGIIDTYCTIARVFKEKANKKNKFCFVDYLQTKSRPIIRLKNCWNPMARKNPNTAQDPRKIDLDSVVSFDINLGEMGDAHHLMLTGPNASGKSTFMRSILYSTVLAQTFGIAFANQMQMTPFAFIDSFYDAAQDNSNSGDSSHKSQIKKLTNLIAVIDKFKNKPILFMGDEICGTTNDKDASSTAIGIGKYIADKIPNSIFALSSHHEKATLIERETANEFRNYKIEAIVSGDSVNWTHKPTPGINSVSTNIQLLKDAGMKQEIIDNVKNIKSRL